MVDPSYEQEVEYMKEKIIALLRRHGYSQSFINLTPEASELADELDEIVGTDGDMSHPVAHLLPDCSSLADITILTEKLEQL